METVRNNNTGVKKQQAHSALLTSNWLTLRQGDCIEWDLREMGADGVVMFHTYGGLLWTRVWTKTGWSTSWVDERQLAFQEGLLKVVNCQSKIAEFGW